MPRRKEEEEKEPRISNEEIQEEINRAAAATARKMQSNSAVPMPLAIEQDANGYEEEDDAEDVALRSEPQRQPYKMHEILAFLNDPANLPGTSRVGADQILPAAMNLAISRSLKDTGLDLLEEFFRIYFLTMRSLERKGFDLTMDLGKSMIHRDMLDKQTLEF